MGIKSLFKIVPASAVRHTSLHDYKGHVIAVDTPLYIYQWSLAHTARGASGEPAAVTNNHIRGLVYMIVALAEYGVIPVFVFDGQDKPSSKRKKQRKVQISRWAFPEAKKLCMFAGARVVTAAGESEAECVHMTMTGDAYAVASEDSDVLCLGAERMLRNFKSRTAIREIRLRDVLKHNNVTMDQFVDACVVCPHDYSGVERTYGIETALEMARNGWIDKSTARYNAIRDIYVKPTTGHDAHASCLDTDKLARFLSSYDFSPITIRKILNRIDAAIQTHPGVLVTRT